MLQRSTKALMQQLRCAISFLKFACVATNPAISDQSPSTCKQDCFPFEPLDQYCTSPMRVEKDTMTQPRNHAAWATSPKARPFMVRESPYYPPGPRELVMKNSAVAINPIDYMVQDDAILDYLQYPHILGCDVAGEVVEIGSEVADFAVGQRVIRLVPFPFLTLYAQRDKVGSNIQISHGFGLDSGQSKHGAFQRYTVCRSELVCPLPAHISFPRGVVLPCAVSTAAAGLYQEDHLHLKSLSINSSPRDTDTSKIVLVWGGASSVGSCAIQLAKASGYEVFTTASARNHELCTALGAAQAFDYRDAGVEDGIIDALRGKALVGVFDAVSTCTTIQMSVNISALLGQGTMVVTTNPVPDEVRLGGVEARAGRFYLGT